MSTEVSLFTCVTMWIKYRYSLLRSREARAQLNMMTAHTQDAKVSLCTSSNSQRAHVSMYEREIREIDSCICFTREILTVGRKKLKNLGASTFSFYFKESSWDDKEDVVF